jgi:predicted RND superfamily exporter protein
MFHSLIKHLIERPALFVASVLMLALPFVRHSFDLPFNNRVDFYFEEDDLNLREYKDFSSKFRSYESFVAVFAFDDLFTLENLDILRRVSFAVKGLDKIKQVTSLTSTKIVRQEDGGIKFEPIVPKSLGLSGEQLAKMRREILGNPQVKDKLVSSDGRHAMMVVELAPTESNQDRDAVITQVKSRINEMVKGSGVKRVAFVGLPLGEGAVEKALEADNKTFVKAIPIAIGVIVLITVRNWLLAGVLVFSTLLTSGWILGVMYHMGEPLNPVTIVINPTLIATGIAEGIHIVTHLLHLLKTRKGSRQSILLQAVKDMWFPCFMTSMTSVVGYLSFLSGDIRPIRMVGLYMALGLVLAYFLSVFLIPALISLLYRRSSTPNVQEASPESSNAVGDYADSEGEHLDDDGLFERICRFNIAHAKWTGSIALVGIGILLYGLNHVRIETNFESYLPPASQERSDLDYVEKNVGFLMPFELVVSLPEGAKSFADPLVVSRLASFQETLYKKFEGKYVGSTWSFSDYVALLNKNLAGKDGLPATSGQIEELLELGDSETLGHVLTPDYKTARVTLFGRFPSSLDKQKLVDSVDDLMKREYSEDFNVSVTGLAMLYHWLGERIFSTQISSFSTAFLPIFVMMVALGGGLRLGLISMIPNIIPILGIFGLMGWLQIPLETSTVMIASIVLGIAVDDTIHFLHWYRRLRLEGLAKVDAIAKTFGHCGRASLFTSTIVAFGFAILMLSEVAPLKYFGMLTALAMAIGVVSEFLLLPLSLYLIDSNEPPKESLAKPFIKGAMAIVKGEAIKKDSVDRAG